MRGFISPHNERQVFEWRIACHALGEPAGIFVCPVKSAACIQVLSGLQRVRYQTRRMFICTNSDFVTGFSDRVYILPLTTGFRPALLCWQLQIGLCNDCGYTSCELWVLALTFVCLVTQTHARKMGLHGGFSVPTLPHPYRDRSTPWPGVHSSPVLQVNHERCSWMRVFCIVETLGVSEGTRSVKTSDWQMEKDSAREHVVPALIVQQVHPLASGWWEERLRSRRGDIKNNSRHEGCLCVTILS